MVTTSHSETILRRFHAEYAGATSRLCQAPTSKGVSSYGFWLNWSPVMSAPSPFWT
jgi:hypothetical protein